MGTTDHIRVCMGFPTIIPLMLPGMPLGRRYQIRASKVHLRRLIGGLEKNGKRLGLLCIILGFIVTP